MRPEAFAAIPDVVLGPLAGRPDADWHRAPPGKWTAAQIVHHLAISIDGSGRIFEDRRAKPPMRRRPRPLRQRLGQFVYLDVGWIPSGRPAPAATQPAERPDAGAVERQLRDGVARFLALARELLPVRRDRSEEHTSELQSQSNIVCRLLLEKKKKKHVNYPDITQTTSNKHTPTFTRSI